MRWMTFCAGLLASGTGWAQAPQAADPDIETVDEVSATKDEAQSPAEPELETAKANQTLGDMTIEVETAGEGDSVLLRLTGVTQGDRI